MYQNFDFQTGILRTKPNIWNSKHLHGKEFHHRGMMVFMKSAHKRLTLTWLLVSWTYSHNYHMNSLMEVVIVYTIKIQKRKNTRKEIFSKTRSHKIIKYFCRGWNHRDCFWNRFLALAVVSLSSKPWKYSKMLNVHVKLVKFITNCK